MLWKRRSRRRTFETKGGYPAGPKRISELAPPPPTAGIGTSARTVGRSIVVTDECEDDPAPDEPAT